MRDLRAKDSHWSTCAGQQQSEATVFLGSWAVASLCVWTSNAGGRAARCTMQVMAMSTVETLAVFSAWLEDNLESKDIPVDHKETARQFIEEWESQEDPATLAGRPHTQPKPRPNFPLGA